MATSVSTRRNARYKPALALVSALGTAWVFVLVTLGAFTTSIGAGMVFPDWPLSNGSLNPHGWLQDLAMFAEHSHRLSAGVMSIATIVVAVWLYLTESRAWLRKLGYFAVALVLVQALVGGLRVLLDHQHVEMVDTSVGRLFAMAHACLAQAFVCTLIAITVACMKGWITQGTPVSDSVRRAGVICCVLLFVQLAIASIMRHSFAGLAIPSFPHSTPTGDWLPATWNFRVGIHFAHRVMAVILSIALIWFAYKVRLDRNSTLSMRATSSALMSLLALQIFLGAQIIWTQRSPETTTGHVLVGAATLATTFWLTWRAYRDPIENKAVA